MNAASSSPVPRSGGVLVVPNANACIPSRTPADMARTPSVSPLLGAKADILPKGSMGLFMSTRPSAWRSSLIEAHDQRAYHIVSRSFNNMPPPTPSTSPNVFHHQTGIVFMLRSFQRSNRLELEEILHRYPELAQWHLAHTAGRSGRRESGSSGQASSRTVTNPTAPVRKTTHDLLKLKMALSMKPSN